MTAEEIAVMEESADQTGMTKEWAAMARHCRGCIYQRRGRYCDYIGIVGHKRPCPPGKKCTVKTVGDRRNKVNYDLVMILYKQGKSDAKVAEIAGCGVSTVAKWRKDCGLPPNKGGGRRNEISEN